MLRTPIHPWRARWPAATVLFVALLVTLYQPTGRVSADPGGTRPASALGAPRVSTAADATANRVAPELRQAAAAASGPDVRLPVIVVSQGPAQDGGVLQSA